MDAAGRLTARASRAVDLVLCLGFLAVAVHGGVLAARALGFFRTDASAFATAAGCWDGSSRGRHVEE